MRNRQRLQEFAITPKRLTELPFRTWYLRYFLAGTPTVFLSYGKRICKERTTYLPIRRAILLSPSLVTAVATMVDPSHRLRKKFSYLLL